MTETIDMTEEHLDALAASVDGPVLRRGDARIAAELAGWNTTLVHDPAVVVGATSEADVQAAVRFAAAERLPLRVLATGHGTAHPIDGGLALTTSRLNTVEIEPGSRRARLGAGVRWGAVIAAAAEHGLAPIAGSSATVGAAGFLLGGGVGPLARTFGFSSDFVTAVRLVTASGEAVTASAGSHPELFWALRGGKGGFGVVTSIEIELVPLRTFYGGALMYEAEHIPTVLQAWAAFTETAPETVTTSVAVMSFPPLEIVPEPMRGKTLLALRFAHVGDASEGAQLAAPLVSVAPALLGRIGEMPAGAIAQVHQDPDQPGPSWDRGMMLDRVSDGFVDAFLELFGPGAPRLPLMAAEIRHLGGATRRDVPGGSAVGGRDGAFTFLMVGAPDPALFAAVLPAAADAVTGRLAPWISAVTTPNFCGDLTAPGALEAAWPAATRARLAAVRVEYDPAALFPFPG